MGDKLYKIFIKYYKKFLFLCYFFLRIVSSVIWFIYRFNLKMFDIAERELRRFNRIWWEPFIIIYYYFFWYKHVYYDWMFCTFVNRIWIISGARWFFYNKMKYWGWMNWVELLWFDIPEFFEEYTIKIYSATRMFIWKTRFGKDELKWYIYCFLRRHGKPYKKTKKYKNNWLKYFFLLFSCIFIVISFIDYSFFINIARKWFFLIKKKIIFFVMCDMKYFYLYLKVMWYFDFKKDRRISNFFNDFRKFNLYMDRKKLKWKIYFSDERFNEVEDFYYIIFNFFISSIEKSRTIFTYWNLRKNLESYGFGERKKWHKTNVYYNLIFFKLIKKKYKKYRFKRYVIWIENLRLYRLNYNFFYFYKFFFFIYNFLYSNFVNILDMYLDLYLNIIIYLAS